MILCARTEAPGLQRVQAWSFLSASFRDTQVLSMEALSLHHTRWSVRPKTWAANWAAASAERIVEQPRPAGREEAQSGRRTRLERQKKCCTHHSAYGGRTRHPVHPSQEWEAGSWWRGRPCFQTSPDPDRCSCQPQPQTLWVRHHLRRKNNAKHSVSKSSTHTITSVDSPSYSALMRSVSSGPLCAEVTLRVQGIPKELQAFRIFSQWAISEVDPINTTTLPLAWLSSNSWNATFTL